MRQKIYLPILVPKSLVTHGFWSQLLRVSCNLLLAKTHFVADFVPLLIGYLFCKRFDQLCTECQLNLYLMLAMILRDASNMFDRLLFSEMYL